MQGYSFTPPTGLPREGQKNYVFVDEHNRHKRLKVMRACNGCRKRKIKCDAATTNTWPCSACTRLKLVCVPPSIGQNNDFEAGQSIDTDSVSPLGMTGASAPSLSSFPVPQNLNDGNQTALRDIAAYNDGVRMFQHFGQPNPDHPGICDLQSSQIPMPGHPFQDQTMFSTTETQDFIPNTASFGEDEQSTAEGLSEVLGELKIDETGIAPYIRQQRQERAEPEVPLQDEGDEALPPLNTRAGSTIRIPPELMPSDDEVMAYFKTYFDDIHPYVPVVHRSHLYHQWQHDRGSISPLLLEALFACVGRLSDDPAQGAQWLALANRHESSFMDVPRLSTIQALLLLLKARESLPKRGYYYRSWQTVKTIISMAKDLDIHEHCGLHEDNAFCGSSAVDCLIQIRVWQVLLVVEVMIGAPQGRSDYGVDLDTVELRPVLNIKGLDQFEVDRSRHYAHFVQNARHIRIITDIYHKIKRQKDWGANPTLVEKNPVFADWLQNLPPDLQVNYPADGSPPWIPSHFVGNMHSHCHLGIILLHRPQLLASRSFATGGDGKSHMAVCYSSAKYLCRLQEAILERFGLSGLLFMQRGINFSIYCVLTCTMLHLVAITSPDPNFHTDAREYFARHMRILERCSSAWPMPEIQAQIDSLRLAFSADISRPFELKSTFPYGSPSEQYHPSPPLGSHYDSRLNHVPIPSGTHSGVGFTAYPITPPISAGTEDLKSDSSQLQHVGIMPHPVPSHSLDAPLVDENSWDPTRIINQWNMAFSMGPSPLNSNSPPMPINHPVQSVHTSLAPQYPQYGTPAKPTPTALTPPATQHLNTQQVVFTARDWQQNVASVFDPNGLKRRWNHSVDLDAGHTAKRQR